MLGLPELRNTLGCYTILTILLRLFENLSIYRNLQQNWSPVFLKNNYAPSAIAEESKLLRKEQQLMATPIQSLSALTKNMAVTIRKPYL